MTFLLFPLPGESWPSEFRVGVALLGTKGVSSAYEYLARGLSLELTAQVLQCTSHVFSAGERESFKKKIISGSLAAHQGEMERLLIKRDQMLFDVSADKAAREALDKEIRVLKEKAPNPEKEPALGPPPEVLVLVPAEKNLSGDMLPPPAGSPDFYEVKDLDFLVWGSLEQVESLLFLTVEIYSFLERKSVFRYREAALPESAGDFITNIRSGLRESLLGRSWADLTVTVAGDLPGEIFLDGTAAGVTRLEASCLIPGEYLVEVRAPGYLPWSGDIVLSPGEEKNLVVDLEALGVKRTPVRSYPPGADVFLDSQWMGTTPLILDVPPRLTMILLRKEGYSDWVSYWSPGGPRPKDVVLGKKEYFQTAYLETRRDKFYRSLGAFFLSLPVSIVMYSAFSNYSQAYSHEITFFGVSDEAARLYSLGNLAYYGYLGALAFNGVCFVNLILDTVSYVKSAGRNFKE